MVAEKLEIYTIYKSPLDWQGEYVIKKWIIDTGKPFQDLNYLFNHKDLKKCREEMIKKGLFNLGRNENDDPVILESWI